MDKEITYKGWVDVFIHSNNSTSWMHKQVQMHKRWKRKFVILYSSAGHEENPRLGSYDKEENNLLDLGDPKKILILHPFYRIHKRKDVKGRKEAVVISDKNNNEWYISDKSQDILDKWATQIQMQSKLSRSISTNLYIVDCADSEEMHRIGASQQKCILYFNKFGVTLALARSRSVMAFWPLKTIRNFEYNGENNGFVVEAGRKAPMGEGFYLFHTSSVGKCKEMFQTMEGLIDRMLHKKADLTDGSHTDEETDEHHAYLQLYESAVITNSLLPPAVTPYKVQRSPMNTTMNTSQCDDVIQPVHSLAEHPSYGMADLANKKSNNSPIPHMASLSDALSGLDVSSGNYDKLDHFPDKANSLSSNYNNVEKNLKGGNSAMTYDVLCKDSEIDMHTSSSATGEYAEIDDNIIPAEVGKGNGVNLTEELAGPVRFQESTTGSSSSRIIRTNEIYISAHPPDFPVDNSGTDLSSTNNMYDKLDHNPDVMRSSTPKYDNVDKYPKIGGSTYDVLNDTASKSGDSIPDIYKPESEDKLKISEECNTSHTEVTLPEDVYDVPQYQSTLNKGVAQPSYDVPHAGSNDRNVSSDVNVPLSHSNPKESNISREVNDINTSTSNRDVSTEIYDTPQAVVGAGHKFQSEEASMQFSSIQFRDVYDSPKSHSKVNILGDSYDVVPQHTSKSKESGHAPETYDVPRISDVKNTEVIEQQFFAQSGAGRKLEDYMVKAGSRECLRFQNQENVHLSTRSSEDMYDSPKSHLEVNTTQDLYDVPRHGSKLKEGNDCQDTYDVPKTSDSEYMKANDHQLSDQSAYCTGIKLEERMKTGSRECLRFQNENIVHSGPILTQDIYDSPQSHSRLDIREDSHNAPQHRSELSGSNHALNEYDVPRMCEVEHKKVMEHEFRATSDGTGFELYDVPSSSHQNCDKTLSSSNLMLKHSTQELAEHFLYEVPSSSVEALNNTANQ